MISEIHLNTNRLKTKYFVRVIFILLFCLFNRVSNSQIPNCTWVENAGGSQGLNVNVVQKMAKDSKGNIFVAGYFQGPDLIIGVDTFYNSGSSQQIYIAKYDSNGTVLWSKSAGGPYGDLVTGLLIDANDNVYLAGNLGGPEIHFDTDTVFANNFLDGFIVKLDSAGHSIWIRALTGSGPDMIHGISFDLSGNVLLTGELNSDSLILNNNDTLLKDAFSSNTFILNMDKTGMVLWGKTIHGYSSGEIISSDLFGNIFVGGRYTSTLIIPGDTISNNSGLYFLKCDSVGYPLWVNGIQSHGLYKFTDIAIDPLNNIYVQGFFDSDSLCFLTDTLINHGDLDVFLAKYETTGNELWVKCFGGWSDELCSNISFSPSGLLYMTCSFKTPFLSIDTTDLTNNSLATYPDLFVAGLDTAGKALWAFNIGGRYGEDVGGIIADSSGFYLAGTLAIPPVNFQNMLLTNHRGGDFFVSKWGDSPLLADPFYISYKQIDIFPNPAQSLLRIKLPEEIKGPLKLSIYNSLGSIISEITGFAKQCLSLDVNSYPNGFYFLRVNAGDNTFMKKFIIEH